MCFFSFLIHRKLKQALLFLLLLQAPGACQQAAWWPCDG
jgi:hypothetical protein